MVSVVTYRLKLGKSNNGLSNIPSADIAGNSRANKNSLARRHG